ncbi:hypothetical protein OLMES_0512 [Oleiphilus messinensis]|uniref:Uncharacterized protein n=1 Tax=Oleiphilus messinensis TaxID=141451 RepID=A0A1Y0I501_9GAMM|nr:hypothetical protein [Oleiphilus messinensis]ARU54615.1 hypothetical protein OLMES_0512 [Oleiphilus messinensis]
MKSLTNYFKFEIEQYPDLLPVVHVTTYKRLCEILEAGYIEADNICQTIKKAVTFLSYGGAYYRIIDTKDEIQWPVALMYSPDILKYADDFLPYDSGAISKKLYGKWNAELSNFDKYSVPLDSSILLTGGYVKRMFGNNLNYLLGQSVQYDEKESLPPELMNLLEFYSEPRSEFPEGVDRRRHMLELHFSKKIPISKHILWVALPDSKKEDMKKIKSLIGPDQSPVIHPFYYETPVASTASEISAEIMVAAKDFLRKIDFGWDNS